MKNAALKQPGHRRGVHNLRNGWLIALGFVLSFFLQACSISTANEPSKQQAPALPVLTLSKSPVTTYEDYSAVVKGSNDIEIRPQVNGQLDHIYVDEGAFVQRGQSLFKINSREYLEQLHSAQAGLAAAEANLVKATINVSKLQPLVESGVISEVQLKSAKAEQQSAEASRMEAKARVESARINLDYTVIKAPSDGYIGQIPFKTGSLVQVSNPEALTVLSEIKQVHVYFSLSENDFARFKERFPGDNILKKIKALPPVELVLSDGTIYPEKGTVEMASGQFDNHIGAISFRAVFPNEDGLLRSGNTGKIRIPQTRADVILVPQEATYELQDKVFVFVVTDKNRVESKLLPVSGKVSTYYWVEKGVTVGEHIVYAGLDRLKEGAIITPQYISMDSLIAQQPL